jgi:hypothetical protein
MKEVDNQSRFEHLCELNGMRGQGRIHEKRVHQLATVRLIETFLQIKVVVSNDFPQVPFHLIKKPVEKIIVIPKSFDVFFLAVLIVICDIMQRTAEVVQPMISEEDKVQVPILNDLE